MLEPEIWHKWHPNDEVSGKYFIKSIDDAIGKFTISLISEQEGLRPLRVVFYESIDISKGTKITYCKATLECLTQKYDVIIFDSQY